MVKGTKTVKQAFGGKTYDFSKDKTPLNKIFGAKTAPTDIAKLIWEHMRATGIAAPKKETPVKTYSNPLEEAWETCDFDELDEKTFLEFATTVKAGKKMKKMISNVFKLQDDDPDAFEEEIAEIYEDLIEQGK